THWQTALKHFATAQVVGDRGAKVSPVCYLSSAGVGLTKKLEWSEKILASSELLGNLPYLMAFFKDLMQAKHVWTSEERAILARIRLNAKAKESLLAVVSVSNDAMIVTQAEILQFMTSIGWIDEKSYQS